MQTQTFPKSKPNIVRLVLGTEGREKSGVKEMTLIHVKFHSFQLILIDNAPLMCWSGKAVEGLWFVATQTDNGTMSK